MTGTPLRWFVDKSSTASRIVDSALKVATSRVIMSVTDFI
jgi:hypothetical protein